MKNLHLGFWLTATVSSLLVGCSIPYICEPGSGQSCATTSEEVKTQGIGNEENLVGTDAGPQENTLGIRSFYFAFDSSALANKDVPTIKAHADYLLKHPEARVVIEGNTDIRGSREYNIGLGQRRADAVVNILRMSGVSSKQIRTLSYGAERPVALGHSEDAYRLNRRADIRYEAQ